MKWIKPGLILVAIIFLFLFIRATDFNKVRSSLQQVGYRFFYLLTITCLAYLSATIGWKFCFGKVAKSISLLNLFFTRLIGETVSIINPTSIVGGEAVKVYMLTGKGITQQTIVISVLISRMIMILTQVLLFFLSVSILGVTLSGTGLQLPSFPVFTGLLILSAVLLLWYLANATWFRNLLRTIPPGAAMLRFGSRVKLKRAFWWSAFKEFFKANKKRVALSVLFFTIHWMIGSLEFYFIGAFLNVKIGLLQALVIDMGVIIFKSAGAFVPGQIGIEEFANKVMLSMAGITDTEIWVTASILRRSRQLCWMLFGVVAYFWIYKKWGALRL